MSDRQPDAEPGLGLAGDEEFTDFAAEIADQMQSFVVAVREVARAEEPNSALSMLLLQTSQVLLAGGRLGAIVDVVPDEQFEPDIGDEPDVDGLRDALASLLGPLDEYTEVFDPYEPEAEASPFRLSDDLADVVIDLTHGLEHYRARRVVEAMWWWQYSYLQSWGVTAGSAYRALHSIVAHSRLDPPEDDPVVEEDRLLAEVAADAVERPGP